MGRIEGRPSPDKTLKRQSLYYEIMEWDRENGKPTRGKLFELNLESLL